MCVHISASEYRSQAPYPDTRCERCPSYVLKRTNDLSLKLDCRSREFHLLTGRGHIAKDFGPKLFKGGLNATLTGLVYFTQAFFKKTNFTLNFGGWEVSVDQPQRTDLFSFGPRYPVGYCNSENENG